MLLAQAVLEKVALSAEEFDKALATGGTSRPTAAGIRGPAVTPFLLSRMAELTGGRSLRANRELIVANARLAAEVAANAMQHLA